MIRVTLLKKAAQEEHGSFCLVIGTETQRYVRIGSQESQTVDASTALSWARDLCQASGADAYVVETLGQG